MKRTTRQKRVTTAFVAWAYLVGSLLISFHFAVDRHAICLEHQTVHHVVDSDASEDVSIGGLPQLRSVALEDDDHCELTQFFQNPTLSLRAATSDLVPDGALVVRRSPKPVVHDTVAIPRWRLAPKQSPPTV